MEARQSTQPRRTSLKALQAKCDIFNTLCPIGSNVIVTLNSGDELATTTRSDAQVLSGHGAVVWMNNVRGCYLLDRVSPAVVAA